MTPSASLGRPLRGGRRSIFSASLAVLVGVCGTVSGQNQEYKSINKPPGFDAAKQAAAASMISSGTVTDDKLLLDFFVSMLADLSDPNRSKNMHRVRADIKKQLQTAGAAPVTMAHDKANDVLVKGLPKLVANPKLHPAVRYNCALLLADLDSVERKGQANPVPLPAALDKLLELLANPKLHDSVRLATLVGVTRHATYVDDAANRAKIAQATLNFLVELDKADGQARNRDVKSWFEARAMEALGATVTPTPEVVAAIQTRLADVNRPLWVRCAAAVSLGNLTYQPDSKVDAPALVASCKSLVDTAVDQSVTRRELREVLFSVKRGIAGDGDPAPNSLVTLLTEEQKKESNQMGNAMGDMIEKCDDAKVPEARIPKEIKDIVTNWRAGKYPADKLGAKARAILEEEETDTSGEEEAPEEGVDLGEDFDAE